MDTFPILHIDSDLWYQDRQVAGRVLLQPAPTVESRWGVRLEIHVESQVDPIFGGCTPSQFEWRYVAIDKQILGEYIYIIYIYNITRTLTLILKNESSSGAPVLNQTCPARWKGDT